MDQQLAFLCGVGMAGLLQHGRRGGMAGWRLGRVVKRDRSFVPAGRAARSAAPAATARDATGPRSISRGLDSPRPRRPRRWRLGQILHYQLPAQLPEGVVPGVPLDLGVAADDVEGLRPLPVTLHAVGRIGMVVQADFRRLADPRVKRDPEPDVPILAVTQARIEAPVLAQHASAAPRCRSVPRTVPPAPPPTRGTG
jgi:hypothetical protein